MTIPRSNLRRHFYAPNVKLNLPKMCLAQIIWLFLIMTAFKVSVVAAPLEGTSELPPTIKIQKNEMRTITLSEDKKVRLSRRGIIHMEHIQGKQWRILGLQAGIVAIKSANSYRTKDRPLIDENSEKLLMSIQVLSSKETSGQQGMQNASLKGERDLCQSNPRVRCTLESQTISGIADSLEEYNRLYDFASRQHWSFRVSLEPATIEQIQRGLIGGLPSYIKSEIKNGYLIFEVPCNANDPSSQKSFLDFVSGGLIARALAFVECSREHLQQYFLKAKFVLSDSLYLKQQGINFTADPKTNGVISKKALQLVDTLEYQQQDQKVKVIGEPRLAVLPQQLNTVESGGEILLTAAHPDDNDKKINVWKKYGLKFAITIQPHSNPDKVILDYDLTLSHPDTSGNSTNLSVSHLQANQVLALGDTSLLGIIDVDSSSAAIQGQSWFSQLPLISPLFKGQSEQSSHHQLIAWVTISQSEVTNQNRLP